MKVGHPLAQHPAVSQPKDAVRAQEWLNGHWFAFWLVKKYIVH